MVTTFKGREMSPSRILDKIHDLRGEIKYLEERYLIVSAPGYKEAVEEKRAQSIVKFAANLSGVEALLRALPPDVLASILASIGK
jgi:hypothetical protein